MERNAFMDLINNKENNSRANKNKELTYSLKNEQSEGGYSSNINIENIFSDDFSEKEKKSETSEGSYIGRESDYGGDDLFEGDYLNGIKWNGKGCDVNNNIIYRIKNGQKFFGGYLDILIDQNLSDDYSNMNDERIKFVRNYMNALSTDDFLNNDYLKLKFDGEYLDGKKWNGKRI